VARRGKPTAEKTTVTEKAYHAIKQAILVGEIREGSFLSEADIRKKYGVGRTPFRETCNRLHNERILEVVPHRGYFVPELSFRAVREIFEARLILESAIAGIAASRAEPDQLRELKSIEARLMSILDSPSRFEEVVAANTEFHLCLATMTQNRELYALQSHILEQMVRLSYLEYRTAGFNKPLTRKHHGPIVEAISKRDPAAAREAVLDDISQAQAVTIATPTKNTPAAVRPAARGHADTPER
jgi:GntR family transcriptional regulator, rspAB operon transcriptional repressor